MLKIKGRKGLKIFFDCDNPDYVLDTRSCFGVSDIELKEIIDKPFIVNENFKILVYFDDEEHCFVIPKGYTWNGANVPPFAWVIIGQRTDPRFMLASCVHDYMCEHHHVVNNNRYLSTLIFETLCEHFGRFNDFKRWSMFHSVDNFQKMFGRDLEGKRW